MNREYYQQRLVNYLRLSGSKSVSTFTVYQSTLNLILNRFPEPEKADLLQIQEFALTFSNDNTRKNICVVLRWLFNKCLNQNIQWYELPYPKKKQRAQPVYQQADIMKVLRTITNPKQKAILALIIDCGLRVSEPCSLLLTDCNSKNRSIIIRSAKGDNDRTVYPSENVWRLIKIYWQAWRGHQPIKYLFEGHRPGLPYTEESIRAFVKDNCQKAGVKYLGVHAIRRFTGTWEIENGVPLTVTANKFGHKGTRTLEKHYVIHSPVYLKNSLSPMAALA